jgi:MFS transporter, NNP family, nitrate/nitrite transporter
MCTSRAADVDLPAATNLAFRQSFLILKNGDGAYIAFIACYIVCCLVTWVVFIRQRPGRLLGV